MAGILMLLCFLTCGVVTAISVFRHVCRLAQVWLGLCLGLMLMMWLPALFAFFTTFNTAAQWLGLAAAGGIAAACAVLFGRKPQNNRTFGDGMPVWLPLALAVPFTLLSAYLQYTHTLRLSDGAMYVGQSTYGDLCLHLGFATSFQNASFPPDYSIL